jgi:two-component system torCAD operon response regulator TorR
MKIDTCRIVQPRKACQKKPTPLAGKTIFPDMPTTPGNARLLIVEDDDIVRDVVTRYLETNGFEAEAVASAAAAVTSCSARAFDLLIIDVNLPDGSGIDLAMRLRARRDTAVIFMTGLGSPDARVHGLESGGDDYIVKPVEVRELLARVRAVLRRYRRQPGGVPPAKTVPVIEFQGWTLDLVRRELADPAGALVRLTRAEFDLFAALVQATGGSLSRDYLLEVVSSAESGTKARTIDVMVSRIRKKLSAAAAPTPRIVTQAREGYRFEVSGS